MTQIAQIPQYLLDAFNLPVTLPVLSLVPRVLPPANVGEVRKYNNPPIRKSRFGTFIYESLELRDESGEVIYQFPDQVLIEMVEGRKNIVRTQIQGRDGTVKEYIGMDDYVIRIMGVINNRESKDYPEDLVADLVRVYERKESLRIDGSNLCVFGIHQIVLFDLQLSRKPGHPSQQPFVLEAYSDEPVELEILNQ